MTRDQAEQPIASDAINRLLNRTASQIAGLADANRPILVAITGPDASGKSTFAAALSSVLGSRSRIIHVDDFHNEKAIRYGGPDEAENYLRRSINFDLLEEGILRPARERGRVSFACSLLDLEADSFSRRVEVEAGPGDVLLVEGVFLLQRRLRHYFDHSIFLWVPLSLCAARGIARDRPTLGIDAERRYREKYLVAQARHMAEERPEEAASIVIDNSDFDSPVPMDAERVPRLKTLG